MAIGKRNKPKQKSLWVATSDLAPRSGHPFYTRLNRLLDEDGFDARLEQECAPYFAAGGRPSIPPGVYFRMLFIGYLAGVSTQRTNPRSFKLYDLAAASAAGALPHGFPADIGPGASPRID